jgi:hypothetical protein
MLTNGEMTGILKNIAIINLRKYPDLITHIKILGFKERFLNIMIEEKEEEILIKKNGKEMIVKINEKMNKNNVFKIKSLMKINTGVIFK